MSEPLVRPIKSVSEISFEIRQLLDSEFRFIRVRGEISNIRQPFSGHTYFVLKDEKSQLNAVLFKNQQRWLSRPLEDGQQIICDGRISVYEARGQYQLIIDTIDFDGTGQLRILFEQLKDKLRSEGLFDSEHKTTLPPVIDRIALITSPTGAAVHDFLSVCRKRHSDALIQILPVRVQGQSAREEICKALDTAHTLSADVIVLCRGGGSIEDLWPFNEEMVARAIHQAKIPIVSGIGHETDFTIADFCADVRCPTPTAAAQLVTTDPAGYLEKLNYLATRLQRSLEYLLTEYTTRINHAAEVLSTFDKAFSHHTFTVENLFSRICGAVALSVEKRTSQFSDLESRLLHVSPAHSIRLYQNQLQYQSDKFIGRTYQLIESKHNELIRNGAKLDTLSPLKTLARGYGIVSKKKGVADKSTRIITSIDQVVEQEEIEIRLHQGEMDCRVLRKKH